MQRQDSTATVNGIRIRYLREGSGPLAVLMHGFPEHSHCWRRLMPLLSDRMTVVAPDMRGYGLSDKPLDGYDKRTMASDIRALVEHLGFERITLMVGHDRGARVAHRFGLDHPDAVEHLVMLDLIPSRHVFTDFDFATGKRYWHWFFHMVPDLPELFIGSNLKEYVQTFFQNAFIRGPLDEAVDSYVESLRRPGALRAALADYRNTFTLDLEQDEASAAAGQKLRMPVLVMWGEKGLNADREKMTALWSQYADHVHTASVPDCGYYMAEEQPQALADHLTRFLEEARKDGGTT